jgi:type VI secretion system FHA domain protein
MLLTLEVIGPQAAKLAGGSLKVFDSTGGTIGRQSGSDWVLSDPYVSNRHASVHYANGTFYIEDTDARNGVYLSSNGREYQLEKGRRYQLQTGDLLVIDPYEIRVSIGEHALVTPLVAEDPFAALPPVTARDSHRIEVDANGEGRSSHGPSSIADLGPSRPEELGLDEIKLDPLSLLKIEPEGQKSGPHRADDLQQLPALGDHYPGPEPVEPDRCALRADRGWSVRDAGAPQSRPRSDISIAEVIAHAGMTNVQVTPELARDFGRILRIVVAGVMKLLQARQEFKSEMGVGVTTIRRTANNPLKCSADVDDALHNLLMKPSPAYLPPVEAFEDAFKDMENHQLAMLGALRSVFDKMLAEFDPDHLQRQFDEEAKWGALLAKPAQWRYWDQYRQRVDAMAVDPERTFRTLIGDELANAYQEQLQRLKTEATSSEA